MPSRLLILIFVCTLVLCSALSSRDSYARQREEQRRRDAEAKKRRDDFDRRRKDDEQRRKNAEAQRQRDAEELQRRRNAEAQRIRDEERLRNNSNNREGYDAEVVLTKAKRQHRADNYECLPQLDRCLYEIDRKIYIYNGDERLAAIQSLGAQEFCEAALPSSTCTPYVVENCADSKPYFVAPYLIEAKIYNYLCTEKYEDVAQHWDCLTSPEVLQGYFNCKYKFQPADTYLRTCEQAALPSSTCTPYVVENCADSKPYFVAPYLIEAKIYNYLCTEKYEDVAQHWDCLTSPEVLQGYFNCKYKFQPADTYLRTCEHSERMAQCVQDIADQTESCGAAAASSVYSIVAKITTFEGKC